METRWVVARRMLGLALAVVLAGCVQIPERPGVHLSSVGQVESDCHVAGPGGIDEAARGLSREHIAVLSWNIYKQGGEEWQRDFRRLSRQRDLLLLQEALLDAELEGELEEADYHWAMSNAFYRGGSASGVLTASSQEALAHCSQYVSEPIIRIPKSLLVSRYPIAGTSQNLLVANVHGINFTTGVGSYREQFAALAEVLEGHHGPVVLAGDFNSWSQSRLDVLNGLAERFGLQRVGYSAYNRKRVFRHSIDHIYYRGLHVVRSVSPSVTSSDHNPLLVTFRLETEQ